MWFYPKQVYVVYSLKSSGEGVPSTPSVPLPCLDRQPAPPHRRYERANKPLSTFDADITRYRSLADEVLSEEPSQAVRCLLLDATPLKRALVGHCDAWVARLAGLLNTTAARELAGLHAHMEGTAGRLSGVPSSLDELAEMVALHRKALAERGASEAAITPLQDRFRLLRKFEVR